MENAKAALRQRLLEEDAFVRKLIDTVPPKIYFDQDVNAYLEEEKHKYIDSNLKSYGIVGGKLKTKGKHKIARFNPKLHKPVSEVIEEFEQIRNQTENNGFTNKDTSLANPLELQERFSRKLEALKAKRFGPKGAARVIAVKQRNKDAKKLRKKKKNRVRKDGNSEETKSVKKKKEPTECQAPIFNKDAKIVYSRFDFGDNQVTKKEPFSGKNNLKKTLKKISFQKEKLQLLADTDPEKAQNVVKKTKWQNALNKTVGIKMKDNPDLLKKSIKKREQKKKRSNKSWATRTEQVNKQMQGRQDRRNRNIRARKQQKIDKKISRARKKGRIVNGF